PHLRNLGARAPAPFGTCTRLCRGLRGGHGAGGSGVWLGGGGGADLAHARPRVGTRITAGGRPGSIVAHGTPRAAFDCGEGGRLLIAGATAGHHPDSLPGRFDRSADV